MNKYKSKSPKPISILVFLLLAVILGILCTFVSDRFAQVGVGYNDYGFPFPWKRVYGGVTQQIDYFYFGVDWLVLSLIIFGILLLVVYLLGWRPS